MVMTGLPLNIDLQQILLHLLNFAILVAGLYILLYKPVKDFMEKRRQHYKDIDDEAEAKLASAKEQETAYEKKMADAESEIQEKKRVASDELETLRVNAEKASKEKAEQIISDAKKEAENAKAQIIKEAEKDITDMVKTAAEKIFVSDNVNDTYEAFLKDAERSVKDGE